MTLTNTTVILAGGASGWCAEVCGTVLTGPGVGGVSVAAHWTLLTQVTALIHCTAGGTDTYRRNKCKVLNVIFLNNNADILCKEKNAH